MPRAASSTVEYLEGAPITRCAMTFVTLSARTNSTACILAVEHALLTLISPPPTPPEIKFGCLTRLNWSRRSIRYCWSMCRAAAQLARTREWAVPCEGRIWRATVRPPSLGCNTRFKSMPAQTTQTARSPGPPRSSPEAHRGFCDAPSPPKLPNPGHTRSPPGSALSSAIRARIDRGVVRSGRELRGTGKHGPEDRSRRTNVPGSTRLLIVRRIDGDDVGIRRRGCRSCTAVGRPAGRHRLPIHTEHSQPHSRANHATVLATKIT